MRNGKLTTSFNFITSGCPKAPEMEAPSCGKSKCCPPAKEEKNGGSKSNQNTPNTIRKRPYSFVLNTGELGEENGEVRTKLTTSVSTSNCQA